MLLFTAIDSAAEKGSSSSKSSTKSKDHFPLPDVHISHAGDAEKAEKASAGVLIIEEGNAVREARTRVGRWTQHATRRLAALGLEMEGIEPIPDSQRTDKRLYQFFFVWFSANANILTLSAGTVGPAFYGLGIRDSFYLILFVDLISCAFPSFFAIFGPKLGTRSMVAARFSWGYYGAVIPSILNVLSMQGYLVINTIVGGQTLAEASPHLDATLGIVIIALISLIITFCGCQVLHWYELLIWIPNVIAFIVMLIVGGHQLMSAPLINPAGPASAAAIMTSGASLAVTVVSWSTLTPDYGVYHDKNASAWRIFWYTYLGFLISSVPAHMLGAAFAAGATVVPAWSAGLGDGNDVGGLVAAVLAPTGRFGKFLLVLLSLTAPSACAPTMYTVCMSFMTVHRAFARLPRGVVAIASTAVLIPVAIVGARSFYETFVDILALIGYWLAPFLAAALTEHILFRRTYAAYPARDAWDSPAHPSLPPPWPALLALAAAVGASVLGMQQVWWTGPVAARGTGDVGMLMGFAVAVGAYAGARALGRRWGARGAPRVVVAARRVIPGMRDGEKA
ncbi:permease for cytosine/purines, uracil, thiamine, allantoin-domain-containing protein [Epithele typhae]|uniref:permease for cytosine/purines, uracil, thiamine, allantoin-domain-containing protein n=1 Tax=Epithele typhae TaxID=378194 RepID=UPI002007E14B|nr:permease for cytosine/purines, uracil, thiamine, allantoin-domain-containing protein [Epithele typhae]KAH9929065.1 permease for cytosine/purines, uracil, thiamine, allantoin-domain-containing protein [Epithele typhae]